MDRIIIHRVHRTILEAFKGQLLRWKLPEHRRTLSQMRVAPANQLLDQMSGIRFEGTTTKRVNRPLYSFHLNTDTRTVERRRRETINEGINELAKIVPGCEKNKGSILQRAVQYITQLRDNETRNIEKWTLEKMLTDQALSEVTSSLDKLKDDLHRARSSAEQYKRICLDNGIDLKDGNDENAGGTDDEGDS